MIYQINTMIPGDDKICIISLRDKLGNLIDLSTVKNIILTLSFKNTIFSVFRLVNSVIDNPVSNGLIELTNNIGEIKFQIKNSTSKYFVTGNYDINVTIIEDENVWTELTDYTINDIVFNSDNYYKCNTTHTSTSVFNDDILNWDLYTSEVDVLKTNYIIEKYLLVNNYGINKTII